MRYQPGRQTDRERHKERKRERGGKRDRESAVELLLALAAHSMQISVTSGELIENL